MRLSKSVNKTVGEVEHFETIEFEFEKDTPSETLEYVVGELFLEPQVTYSLEETFQEPTKYEKEYL